MGDDNVVLYYKSQGADDNKTGLKREDSHFPADPYPS